MLALQGCTQINDKSVLCLEELRVSRFRARDGRGKAFCSDKRDVDQLEPRQPRIMFVKERGINDKFLLRDWQGQLRRALRS